MELFGDVDPYQTRCFYWDEAFDMLDEENKGNFLAMPEDDNEEGLSVDPEIPLTEEDLYRITENRWVDEECERRPIDGMEHCPENYVATPTKNLLTKFYNTQAKWGVSQHYNYDPYDLFALKSKLVRHVEIINPLLSPHLEVLPLEGKMVVSVELYDGSTFHPTDEEMYSKLRPIVDREIEEYPDHCLLIHDWNSILYKGICLHSHWLKTVLKLMYGSGDVSCSRLAMHLTKEVAECSSLVTGEAENGGPIYKYVDGAVLVNLRPRKITYDTEKIFTEEDMKGLVEEATVGIVKIGTKSYLDRYNNLYLRLLDFLVDIFVRGALVLHEEIDKDFIEDWDLEPLIKTQTERHLYVADYRNCFLFSCGTTFLTRQMQGFYEIKYEMEDRNREKLSELLAEEGLPYEIHGKFVHIAVGNYEDLQIADHIVRLKCYM